MRATIFALLILSGFMVTVLTTKKVEDKTVIESNHFYSENGKQAEYTVQSVIKGRPLVLILKKKDQTAPNQLVNPTQITLTSGDQVSDCRFDKYQDLCVVPDIKNTDMKMHIKCDSLPCEVSWIIYQPALKIATDTQKAEQLYEFPSSNNHLIAIITCNDVKVKTFDEDVTLYSDSNYVRSFTNNAIYFMFNNEQKGFMFLDIKPSSKSCAVLSIYKVPTDIVFDANKEIRDYISKDSPAMFALPSSDTDFRIDCSVHSILKKTNLKGKIGVKLTGEKNGKVETISQGQVTPPTTKASYDFSYSFKAVDKNYKNLEFQFSIDSETIIINFRLSQQSKQEVELGETNYFGLKKGEKLSIKLIPNADAPKDSQVQIYPSSKSDLKINKEFCPESSGCDFEVEALNDIAGHVYLGFKSTETVSQKAQQKVEFIEIDKKITKKIYEGDNIYLLKKVKAKEAFQVVVNSPNVLIYASMESKCKVPDEDCYERSMNIHHPFIYLPEKDGNFLFNIQGLDSTEFTLTIIPEEDEYIDLKDSEAFSYVMDEQEQRVLFKFKIPKKQDVSFNLIAPINTVNLIVTNGKEKPSDDSPDFSADGYLTFSKEDIDSLTFTILVKKNQQNKKKFAHFTIIASTSGSNFRLEPGTAHYQTLAPDASRDFIFEFNQKQDYLVNFYTHNLKGQQINLQLMVSNDDKWKDNKNIEKMVIDRQSDVLDLKDISKGLCKETGQNECQIFMRIINTMDVQIDMALTLLVRDAVIELKDGIWQSYAQNQIASTTNFYFYPKHANKGIDIMYNSGLSQMRVVYNIWKTDSHSLNPSEWPFPDPPTGSEKTNAEFKPIKSISIEHETIKEKCWPNCVILLSFYIDKSLPADKNSMNTQFSIMASNSQIELPQKQRLNLALKRDQEKKVMIDLKYAMEKNILSFYMTQTIGFHVMRANVYSERHPRCPEGNDDSDFTFGDVDTIISVQSIKDKMKANDMEEDNNIYLCIVVKALEDTKFSFEYTTANDDMKKIQMDAFEAITLAKGDNKMYTISGTQQFYVKIMRVSGFPFVLIKKCDKGEDYEDCIQKFKSGTDKGKQLVTKTESFSQEPCPDCIYLFKFTTQEPSELSLHLQSKYTQIQLKQNFVLSDFTNQGEENRYLITSIRKEETIININVMEGEIEVQISDFSHINIKKTSDSSKNLVHIVIPASSQKRQQTQLGLALMSAFSLSNTFNYLHMTIRAKDPKVASSFTVLYSSGDRQIYLEDGLITDYSLEPNKLTSFYYVNEMNTDHIFLTLSMENSNSLNELKIKTFYLTDLSDQSSKMQFAVEKPPMRKKTPNPTLLLSLPRQKFFIIELTNPSGKDQKLSIGINHQQVMLLPYSHEYPFSLHPNEDINFLIDVNIPGYVKITVRKCDESSPTFGYTFDYDSFIKNEMSYQTVLSDDPKFEYNVKANQIGTLYIHMRSEDEDSSLLSISVEYSAEKVKKDNIKSGNKGILQYQLLDSTKAEITLTSIICPQKKCNSKVKYYTMSSNKIQDLYTQLVCPSNYFALSDATSITPIPLVKIEKSSESNNKIVFTYDLLDHISYVGVKAIAENGEEVYYRPIQIITIWGQLSRTSQSHKLTIFAVILIAICAMLIFVRNNARKGYKPLNDQ